VAVRLKTDFVEAVRVSGFILFNKMGLLNGENWGLPFVPFPKWFDSAVAAWLPEDQRPVHRILFGFGGLALPV
jgi:hypothetical protein